MSTPFDRAVMIIADGARPDVLGDLLDRGDLPHLQQHIVERGTATTAVTNYTSTSGPGYVPFLTGCFAGTANIPGVRWMEKSQYTDGARDGEPGWRDYCGPGEARFDSDMPTGMRTAFDYTGDGINVFGIVKRGLRLGADIEPALKARLWQECHDDGDWHEADEAVGRLLTQSVKSGPRFVYAIFPGVDGTSHGSSPTSDGVIEAYRRVDTAIASLADTLTAIGAYDRTVIALSSDHGHASVHTHFDVGQWLDESCGIPTRYGEHEPNSAQAAVCVSGNSMAHLYLRTGDGDSWGGPATLDAIEQRFPGLVEDLAAQGSVDVLAIRHGDTSNDVTVLRADQRVAITDPRLTEVLPPHDYPDAALQIEQLFRSPRTGDITISASPGHDLRERFEHPEHHSGHGSLLRAHMLTPFLINCPLAPTDTVRTADVLPTLMELTEVQFDPTVLDGRSLAARP